MSVTLQLFRYRVTKMKYKIYFMVFVLVLLESVTCRDLRNDSGGLRRNIRRIDRGNKSDKSVGEAILDTVNTKQEKSEAPHIPEKEDIQNNGGQALKSEGLTTLDKSKGIDVLPEVPLVPENNENAYPGNNNNKRSGNKRKRLIEVRKTKINTNENGSENIRDTGRDENSYFPSRNEKSLPSWAIPKKHQRSKPEVRIVDMENYVYSNRGEFKYRYESADGTKAYERGELRKLDDNSKGTAVFGGFSYKSKDGENISLQYTADENGYRPIGDHLPTPPPIPPEIARALFYLATKSPPPLPSTEEPSKYDYSDYY